VCYAHVEGRQKNIFDQLDGFAALEITELKEWLMECTKNAQIVCSSHLSTL
jgi:hypothetical protein